ncbi:hypothetical protein GUITHDRAFT_150212 [Guillardia theta CCMP2712]|uniref:LysM domain-containing protein n=1 Tax=Guillardia theta (strain CCMP2712) TaxID=905079 RepID=L1JYT9_GUITC|nr:hypothetical protein GUITHDRAFT_150212 [Guillardia theta CCMP2712]EKX53537.1 hypothetical protein GUITHDRAFT_150212 [Guillardia theta CCMP2712]|eukprot:XP_005840517.1 hypothetical protein GUITHDRAFT_150212 [Guillardia theta CCMP2712]
MVAQSLLSPRQVQTSLATPLLGDEYVQSSWHSDQRSVEAIPCAADENATLALPFPDPHELNKIRSMEKHLFEVGWSTPLKVPQGMKVKCVNCESWFSASDNAVEAKAADQSVHDACVIEDPNYKHSRQVCCQFHPGVYRRSGVTVATGVRTGWSCCRQISESALGCKRLPYHTEDPATTALLLAFSQNEGPTSEASAELERRLVEAEKNLQEASEEDSKSIYPSLETCMQRRLPGNGEYEMDEHGNIVHYVRPSDTIQGLSLKYGVSTQRIKEVNGVLGFSIVQYSTLLIPPSESGKCIKRKPKDVRSCGTRVNNVLETLEAADAEGVKDRLLSHLHRRMCALGATSQEEAKAYLSLANNDVEVAVKMYQEDLAWEKQGGSATKFPGTPSCIQDMTTRKSFFNKLSSKLRSKQIY